MYDAQSREEIRAGVAAVPGGLCQERWKALFGLDIKFGHGCSQ